MLEEKTKENEKEEQSKHPLYPPPLQFSALIHAIKALEEDPVACTNSR